MTTCAPSLTGAPPDGGTWWGLPSGYWVLWTAVLVNRLATFMVPFLTLYLTTTRGLPVTTAGLIASLLGAGAMVSGLIGGWSADRIGRRSTLLAGYFLAAITLVALALATTLPALIIAAIAVGLSSDLARPASQALVADVVPAPLRARAYSLSFWAVNIGFSLATLSAGALSRYGFTTLLLIDASSAAIAGIWLWLKAPRIALPRPTGERGGYLSSLRTDRTLRLLVVAGIAYSTVYQQAYTTLPLTMSRQGLGPAAYGVIIAINGLVIIALQPFADRVLTLVRPIHAYAGGLLLLGLGFGATALAASGWSHALVVVSWSVGEVVCAAMTGALFAAIAPAHLRGRYMALSGWCFAIGMAAGPVLGTAVLAVAGAGWLWTGCAITMAAVAATTLLIKDPRIGQTD
ncbi:MFS transporter [Calidifontibacter sp. DB0510]|uniref:MFS transporter n=1 Tax=Metallococcus carri TaxID=1656884 RepID=A0A967B3Q9_9MICO|nr:MFS transporter [Metallococcus carri]NHN56983.1 MFS transporter [Metallococcus carri]NOP37728.1 MFS transporter [Calidifontibacter sp. DB2511S]